MKRIYENPELRVLEIEAENCICYGTSAADPSFGPEDNPLWS